MTGVSKLLEIERKIADLLKDHVTPDILRQVYMLLFEYERAAKRNIVDYMRREDESDIQFRRVQSTSERNIK